MRVKKEGEENYRLDYFAEICINFVREFQVTRAGRLLAINPYKTIKQEIRRDNSYTESHLYEKRKEHDDFYLCWN